MNESSPPQEFQVIPCTLWKYNQQKHKRQGIIFILFLIILLSFNFIRYDIFMIDDIDEERDNLKPFQGKKDWESLKCEKLYNEYFSTLFHTILI